MYLTLLRRERYYNFSNWLLVYEYKALIWDTPRDHRGRYNFLFMLGILHASLSCAESFLNNFKTTSFRNTTRVSNMTWVRIV